MDNTQLTKILRGFDLMLIELRQIKSEISLSKNELRQINSNINSIQSDVDDIERRDRNRNR